MAPDPLALTVPSLSLILLIGISGSGKSTFAAQHFVVTEVVSSDRCRALVADDENDQTVTPAAFDLLHTIVAKRLEAGRLAVADATNLRPDDRRQLLVLAVERHVEPVAIVFDLPLEVVMQRNRERADRVLPDQVLRNQHDLLRTSVGAVGREGFGRVHVLDSVGDVARVMIRREPTNDDVPT